MNGRSGPFPVAYRAVRVNYSTRIDKIEGNCYSGMEAYFFDKFGVSDGLVYGDESKEDVIEDIMAVFLPAVFVGDVPGILDGLGLEPAGFRQLFCLGIAYPDERLRMAIALGDKVPYGCEGNFLYPALYDRGRNGIFFMAKIDKDELIENRYWIAVQKKA